MFKTPKAAVFALLIASVTFAGCVGDDVAPVDDTLIAVDDEPSYITEEGRDLKLEMVATDIIDKPSWQVRERFGIHLYFGPDDQSGLHLNSIVVEQTAQEWILAPDSRAAAKEHSVWDYPIFGSISRNDLSATFFGEPWDIYDFPLSDGHTWTSTITMPRFDSEGVDTWDLNFAASFAPAIETTEGPRPGLVIVGTTADGEVLLETDYVPAIGWFANLKFYDLKTDDASDFMFRVISMGHERGWTGTYYIAEATPMVDVFSYVGLGEEGGDPAVVNPQPRTTFTMSEESDTLFGFLVSFAFAGAHELMLMDPNQEQHEYRAVPDDPQSAAVIVEFLSIDSVPGEWSVIMLGAGGAAGGFAQLWEITTRSFDML